MQFNSASFNSTSFNSTSGNIGYGEKPAMPTGVAVSGEVYVLVLTGVNDTTTDLTLPITNLNLRWTSGGLAWISLTVPNGLEWAESIAARPNGELALLSGERWSNGWVVLHETVRAPLTLARLDEGSQSNSYTLQGYSDMATAASAAIQSPDPSVKLWGGLPKNRPADTFELKGITYRRGSLGSKEVRASVNTSVRPGDTVTSTADSFVVRSIQWYVTVSERQMFLTE